MGFLRPACYSGLSLASMAFSKVSFAIQQVLPCPVLCVFIQAKAKAAAEASAKAEAAANAGNTAGAEAAATAAAEASASAEGAANATSTASAKATATSKGTAAKPAAVSAGNGSFIPTVNCSIHPNGIGWIDWAGRRKT